MLIIISGINSYASSKSNVITCMIYSNQSSASSGYQSIAVDTMFGQTNMASTGPIHFISSGKLIYSGTAYTTGNMTVGVNNTNTISITDYYNFNNILLIASPPSGYINGCIGWGKLYME